MRKTALIAAAGLAATLPFSAMAQMHGQQGPSYSYVEAGYIDLDVDGGPNPDGFFANGSIALSPDLHGLLEYSRTRDGGTLHRTRVMGGYNVAVNPGVDFVARAGWSFYRGGLMASNDDGIVGQAGIRGMATDELELNTFITYDDVEDKVAFSVGGVYNFTPQFGLKAGYSYSSNLEVFDVGFRFNF